MNKEQIEKVTAPVRGAKKKGTGLRAVGTAEKAVLRGPDGELPPDPVKRERK